MVGGFAGLDSVLAVEVGGDALEKTRREEMRDELDVLDVHFEPEMQRLTVDLFFLSSTFAQRTLISPCITSDSAPAAPSPTSTSILSSPPLEACRSFLYSVGQSETGTFWETVEPEAKSGSTRRVARAIEADFSEGNTTTRPAVRREERG